LTGGIRKGAKGEPPVGHFHSVAGHYSAAVAVEVEFDGYSAHPALPIFHLTKFRLR
jgi:hypothetical protein